MDHIKILETQANVDNSVHHLHHEVAVGPLRSLIILDDHLEGVRRLLRHRNGVACEKVVPVAGVAVHYPSHARNKLDSASDGLVHRRCRLEVHKVLTAEDGRSHDGVVCLQRLVRVEVVVLVRVQGNVHGRCIDYRWQRLSKTFHSLSTEIGRRVKGRTVSSTIGATRIVGFLIWVLQAEVL